LDGVIQVTERDELSYQEMMAHLPLYAHPDPKRVLVIGGGDGGVLREIARHTSVTEIVICELDPDVIAVAKKYLPFVAKGFDDPRVKVHIMDGALFMKENQSAFDVIITDSSDPVGPACVLFETPFYKAMHDSLRDGGIICTQGECVWLHVDLIQRLVKAITPLFRTVEYAYCTIPSYPSGQIGFVIATKMAAGGSSTIDNNGDEVTGCKSPVRLPTEKVQEELRYYTPEMHRAAFALPAFAKRAIFGDDA
jgi:spermidine synthase